ncbi:hypothetical protein N431DRAFT_455290 [Stipitochalara longipes BDJ]|nr:hypothetical protein N431DRAFT_455290 [Stipitochalara longipes BDJ]
MSLGNVRARRGSEAASSRESESPSPRHDEPLHCEQPREAQKLRGSEAGTSCSYTFQYELRALEAEVEMQEHSSSPPFHGIWDGQRCEGEDEDEDEDSKSSQPDEGQPLAGPPPCMFPPHMTLAVLSRMCSYGGPHSYVWMPPRREPIRTWTQRRGYGV